MAQLNITLNQDEILQLIATDRDSAFAKLLQDSLNSILKAESTEQLKAERYEHSAERTGGRNGFRDCPLTTRIGQITLTLYVQSDKSTGAADVGSADKAGKNSKRTTQASGGMAGSTYSEIRGWNPFGVQVCQLTDFYDVLMGTQEDAKHPP